MKTVQNPPIIAIYRLKSFVISNKENIIRIGICIKNSNNYNCSNI